MKLKSRIAAAAGGAGLAAIAVFAGVRQARGSDHADTPQIAASPGTDLTDVFIFPSPSNPDNVVLAMNVNPLIATGGSASFDPNVLYQFKIDNTGDNSEDLVIQARFEGTGSAQKVMLSGPSIPALYGTQSRALPAQGTTGTVGAVFSPTPGTSVFAGVREDPFFFDLEQFFTILPDRATPINGKPVAPADANTPKATSWRAPGVAKDFLAGFNVLSIVVELPRSAIRGAATSKIAVWATTSK